MRTRSEARRRLRWMLILGVLLMLSGCGLLAADRFGGMVKEGTTHSESANVIRFLSIDASDTDTDTRIIWELAQEYSAQHPDVRMELDIVQQTSLMQKVQLLTASNDLPHLFDFESGRPLQELVEGDFVLDVEQTFRGLGLYDKLKPDAVDLLERLSGGEGLYAVPLQYSIEGFWYNKEIFKSLNLKPPATWDEMMVVSETLRKEGIQPFAVAGKEKWPLTRLINAYAIRKYGVHAMEMVADGELDITDAGFVEAAEIVQEMNERGYFGNAVNTILYDTALDTFLRGDAAMYYMGSWAIADFHNPERNRIGEENIGFFNIPLVEGGVGTLSDYSVNAGTTLSFSKEKFDETFGDWIQFVFSRYADRAMSELGLISGLKVENMPEKVKPLTRMTLKEMDKVENRAMWFEAFFDTRTKQMAEDHVQLLVMGEMTAEEYLAQLAESIKTGARTP